MAVTARLALDGGTPVRSTPLLPGWPGGLLIGEEEKQAVLEVIESQSLFRHYGPRPLHRAAALEKAFAEAMGARFGLGVTSGTAALITSLAACGVGPGDEVIVPTYTWIATINAVVILGAVPVFVDIDESLNMDAEAMAAAVTPYTRAVVPVHMRGAPADLEPIIRVARQHGLAVVEDAAQAVGGSYRGQRLGTFGDFGAYSLQYHKTITTGEGGMVVTSDPTRYERAVRFHDQGSVRMEELDLFIAGDSPLIIGINFRMGELTAAVGLAQLKKMDWIIEKMRAHQNRIKAALRDIAGITLRTSHDEAGETGATVIFFVPTASQADRFARALAAENIPASVPWWSGQHVYNHFDQIINRRLLSAQKCSWECPRYKGSATLMKGQFPKTDAILQRAVHIDVHPLFTGQDVEDVITGLHKVARVVL
ncbi:MAG: DegT/DnrJ/EryC1/StrS family aminotransferase [Armatimonadota bacterium]|nr:DegT/DnrJ/EryC1/StrS family aminotransferase [Armatimonadota bacterium]